MGTKSRKEEARKRRLGMAEMIEDAYVHSSSFPSQFLFACRDEQDEETLEWEREQIRRAAPAEDRTAALQEVSR